jgi:hypothetical protein
MVQGSSARAALQQHFLVCATSDLLLMVLSHTHPQLCMSTIRGLQGAAAAMQQQRLHQPFGHNLFVPPAQPQQQQHRQPIHIQALLLHMVFMAPAWGLNHVT